MNCIPFCLFIVFPVAVPAADSTDVVINEIMYHPASGLASEEYVELYNRGSYPIDLSGWYFSDGIRYSFPANILLPPDSYLVVAQNQARVREKYGINNVVGNYIGELSDKGERIALSDAKGDLVDEVTYSDSFPWPVAADEMGPSLECVNPGLDNNAARDWDTAQGIVDWTRIDLEGTAAGSRIFFALKESGEAWIDAVQLTELGGLQAEQAVWPMNYRHLPGGDQGLDMHFSLVPVNVDPGRDLLSVQLSQESRIFVFGLTAQAGADLAPVDLSGYFDTDGISWPTNLHDGDLDGGGATYAAELLPSGRILKSGLGTPPIWWNLGPYDDGKNNAIRSLGQEIVLPEGKFSQLHFLVTAVNAQTLYDTITLVYADGSETVGIQVTDWAVAVPDASASQNWVANGSFESSLLSWQLDAEHRNSAAGIEQSYSGRRALHLERTAALGGQGLGVYQDISGMTAGHTYRLQFWVRAGQGSAKLTAGLEGGPQTEIQLGGEGSPGIRNQVWQEMLPPFFEEIMWTPTQPTPRDAVTIEARISSGAPLRSVTLEYTVNQTPAAAPMRDDGVPPDRIAGDGLLAAQLPPQASQTPVLFTIRATDDLGRETITPRRNEPTPRHGYFVYDGDVNTDLPIYFLFVAPELIRQLNRNPESDVMVEGMVAVDGVVFDRIHVRYRGAWARSWPKKNWKIRFNKGRYYNGLRTINLNSNYHDRAYMREKLSYDLFADSSNPGCQARFVWMQLNGEPFGLYTEVEQPDERFLERIHREGGSLYKSEGKYQILGSESQYIQTYEKETNRDESYDALIQMIEDINRIPDAEVHEYFNQHFNVESYVDYLVVNACISNWDHLTKNHLAFQDTAGAGKWEFFPWDLDRTWGEFADWNIYYNQHILTGIKGHPAPTLSSDWWNYVQNRFLREERFLTMYYNRMRDFLQTVFTEERQFARIDALDALIRDEVPWDKQIHGEQANWDYGEEVERLKWYVSHRRAFLFQSLPVPVEDWTLY
ncbi:MAG: CotH kinase family protein [bacterium]